MRNLIRRLAGKPVELSPKQQERMARMQARADAMGAKGTAEARAAMAEAAAITAAAGGTSVAGPAGSGAGGGAMPVTPGEVPQSIPPLRDMLRNSVEGFRDVVGEMSDDRSGVIDSGGADFNRPPRELDDETERERVAGEERAAREAARAAYRAPGATEIVTTVFATTGRAQLDDLTARLSSMRAERVFGVHRVADRMDVQRNGEAGAYMEWAVVHAPDAAGSAAPAFASFRRQDHWVRRSPGDPSVLDEDVAGTYCARAGIEPERCFGVTRLWHVVASDGAEASRSYRGVNEAVLVIADGLPEGVLAQLQSQAPLAIPPTPVLPFHLEILDWEAVAAWVRPQTSRPVRVPSPLPHLPSTPEELLAAYVGIVGLRPEDSYGVQVTRTTDRGIGDLSAAGIGTLRSDPEQPCVDGKQRRRLHAAEHVVLAYRDSAAYQEGRERWRRYQDEVLRARLDHLTGVRAPIEVDLRPRQSLASELFDMVNPLDPVHAVPQLFGRNAPRSLGPYCGGMQA